MDSWFINEASLQGQYLNEEAFIAVLEGILAARDKVPHLKQNLRLSASFSAALVRPQLSLKQLVLGRRGSDLSRQVLAWIVSAGPFIEDDRAAELNDYFECKALDITDGGLGEAARRTIGNRVAGTYSFPGGAIDFAEDPLIVRHGLREDPLGHYPIKNIWSVDGFSQRENMTAPSRSWEEMFALVEENFAFVEMSEQFRQNPALLSQPFDYGVRNAFLRLVSYPNDYAASRQEDGSEGEVAVSIRTNHFVGRDVAFSDESDTNKDRFADEMTFAMNDGQEVFCTWHGKVRRKFFRLHFEWPIPIGRKRLRMAYFGPKITRA